LVGGRASSLRGRRQRTQWAKRRLGADRGDPRLGARPIALIIDAGPLYAYVDADDSHHSSCLELLESHPGPLVIPTLVITEVAYLIETRLGWEAEVRFLGDLAGGTSRSSRSMPATRSASLNLSLSTATCPSGPSMPR